MVGCLQAPPGTQQIFVAAGLHLFFQTVDSRDGVLLHVIAQPGGQVALGEVIVLGVLGLPLMCLLPRNPKFREIIRSYQKE